MVCGLQLSVVRKLCGICHHLRGSTSKLSQSVKYTSVLFHKNQDQNGFKSFWKISKATFSSESGLSGTNYVESEEDFGEFVKEICSVPGMGHHVLVIQPDIKTGSRRYFMTTKQLKLEETCSLVKTLPRWKVVEKKIIRTDFENTKQVFGSGNFEILMRQIRGMRNISAVVIGIDRLTGLQIDTLQKAWGLPVYDRYTIVLQIFKNHANSEEAKLQVSLAEIPYIKARMQLLQGGFDVSISHLVGGTNAKLMDRRRELLQKLEAKIRKNLEKLHSKRQEVRKKRREHSIPTVAVVGYTNAGKTTLIKAITEDLTLKPENHMFATLDVTAHEGYLSHMMKVIFIDTVGFISDMPITLLDAFRATLEDAMNADVVLHVRDASHPDKKLQVLAVHNTLKKMLTEDQMNDMIEVYNKIDLLSEKDAENLDNDILQISALTGQGFPELSSKLETGILAACDLMQKTFRIPNSGPILQWLQKECTVKSALPDPNDGQFLILKVLISRPAYGRFQAKFERKKS